MSEHLENLPALRSYLLGQTTDEEQLTRIEQRLLTDAEFFDELEIVEEELIEDYVAERLESEKLENFRRLFLNVPERREKIRLTRSLIQLARQDKQTVKDFDLFGRRIFQHYAAFGFLVLCVGAAGFSAWWFVIRQTSVDKSLAELKLIYKTERPIQARVSGFDYSPYVVRRGAERENKNQLQRRKIELDLSAKAENEPTAENFNRLGLFYLTEKRFADAVAEFEKGLKLNSQDPEFLNNFAVAFFETAKLESEAEKTNNLVKALDALNKALKLNQNQHEALFNKGLVLQEFKLTTEAAAVWKQYLEKDAESKWADEARRNLREIEKF